MQDEDQHPRCEGGREQDIKEVCRDQGVKMSVGGVMYQRPTCRSRYTGKPDMMKTEDSSASSAASPDRHFSAVSHLRSAQRVIPRTARFGAHDQHRPDEDADVCQQPDARRVHRRRRWGCRFWCRGVPGRWSRPGLTSRYRIAINPPLDEEEREQG